MVAIEQVLFQINDFILQVFSRTIEILISPKNNTEALWLLAPLLITVLLIEFYFGRYTKEELGWNTAYANSLVLIFIAAFLFKYIYENNLWIDTTKMAVMAVLVFIGLALVIIDFLHLIPKKLAFKISSTFPVNFIAYATIILVYSNLPINYITLIAFFILFLAFSIVVWLIHVTAPKIKENIFSSAPSPSKSPQDYKSST